MLKPIIGITMGDAAGVGPEIIVKSLSHASVYEQAKPFVIGDAKVMEQAAAVSGINTAFHKVQSPAECRFEPGTIDLLDLHLLPDGVKQGAVSAEAGNAAFHYLKKAVELGIEGKLTAICTAPLNKEALHLGGHNYPGHTEILAELTGTKDYSMMLSSPKLRVIHLTTHIGLLDAIASITPERTYTVIKLAHDTLVKAGYEQPRIAVCGINPHAGENGLFGNGEEEDKLIPAIQKAEKEGIEVSGPHPADTLFFRAVRGDFDIVVACYHDQGHVPIKVLGLEEGVNITVGLNGGLVRTSVDHGTAFDIAGKNRADERSMLAALTSAADLAPKV
ncbi:4-hydroxythreonine-4-phosphate dehydrogenase PdxA [Aureibacillus halotolerans]|uniref:4-hydroxythreonine-4-phosphate dehydrogenase n=1 Tax=Aureibacillus halotolerans TaxID=1508390 RepID=A0A4R6U8I6_9BACI|nr:4-hydroxythreonine-4-phosphate dehydrogenase PdxA [Aureibacillus halotolerans]TDQ41099.1 4-hydroxythreonine-4-phosphate dehydrogenase [Aureibacillus halotolerans]